MGKLFNEDIYIDNTSMADSVLKNYGVTKSVSGQNIIPFVGLTGAGKSTLSNYLIGCRFRRITILAFNAVVVVGSKEYAKIGHLPKSTTFSFKTLLVRMDRGHNCKGVKNS